MYTGGETMTNDHSAVRLALLAGCACAALSITGTASAARPGTVNPGATENSAIDFDSAIKRLQQQKDPPVWGYLINPLAALRIMRTYSRRVGASANVKRTIAQENQDQLRRDAFISYIHSLQTSLGPMMPQMCNEHGWTLPPKNSIAEAMRLIQFNAELISVENHKNALFRGMNRAIRRQAVTRAKIESARQAAELLPSLISQRKILHPLQRQNVLENTSHVLAILSGLLAVIPTSVLSGLFEGGVIGIRGGAKAVRKVFDRSQSE